MFQDEKFWQRRENVERRQEPVEKDHRCNQLLAIKNCAIFRKACNPRGLSTSEIAKPLV